MNEFLCTMYVYKLINEYVYIYIYTSIYYLYKIRKMVQLFNEHPNTHFITNMGLVLMRHILVGKGYLDNV